MITTLINEHCELAENPLWNSADGCLYWTDIDAGRIHRIELATKRHEVVYEGERVGGFTFQEDGALLLFRVDDVAVLPRPHEARVVREFRDSGSQRFNDVVADPEGRVFAGTIGKDEQSGGLFRFNRDGTPTLLFRGTGVSNGMGFSPDLRTFYWTCSTRRCIYAFDYDRASGSLSGERLFYKANEEEGIPDGLTVDLEGNVWSARWDGFAAVKHRSDGSVASRTPFSVAKVSSLCFGGPKLDTFFVTTAGGQRGSSSEDGSIYQWQAGASGREEFRSAVMLS